jgi:hypothetical protein
LGIPIIIKTLIKAQDPSSGSIIVFSELEIIKPSPKANIMMVLERKAEDSLRRIIPMN